ncbi:PGPGW domain-containing protein [Arthrobacter burdickii]|uniref:PGPGW domain-containing protein n=1 Tax=Arthrobacter burdickii TaxID=3035920 RepID=A0ABT8K4J8_9MICC|nr:PGPGW domain-containing protein [Arthrobacter burdickii]MDN4612366.1 PGPGW domain-containing protein [Arthrobacter burdickii]
MARPPRQRRTGAVFAGRTTPHGASRIIGLIVGWLLVLIGLAALVLPGPGLLALVAGLAVLAQQYEWARRWLQPVKRKAFAAAAQGVKSTRNIVLSFTGALILVLLGVLWGVHPAVPGWWPLGDRWWLPGGWSVGSGLVVSGLLAAAFIVYSIRRFRPQT